MFNRTFKDSDAIIIHNHGDYLKVYDYCKKMKYPTFKKDMSNSFSGNGYPWVWYVTRRGWSSSLEWSIAAGHNLYTVREIICRPIIGGELVE